MTAIATMTSPSTAAAPRHLVDLLGLDPHWVRGLFERADALRAVRGTPQAPRPLADATVALVFHKPSLRTRVSFAAGVHELGGSTVDLSGQEVSATGREELRDVARVLSSLTRMVIVRTFDHPSLRMLAHHATVPVINALTDFSHPCQILSDLYTLARNGRDLDRLTIAWVGDGNNVLNSWLEAATIFGFDLNLAVPDGFEPDGGLYLEAERRARGKIRRYRDPQEAVRGADVVYTDTWVSMGQEEVAQWRRASFAGYTVTPALMGLARPDAAFMHCMPARRGEEVADAVIEGPQSLVLEQAANRLHLQKALMAALLEASPRG